MTNMTRAAMAAIDRTYFYMDHYREQGIWNVLLSWEKAGYLNALALIVRHPKFFEEVKKSVEKHGNVSELHQSNDGIFTVVYSSGHEDYLLENGRVAIRRAAA